MNTTNTHCSELQYDLVNYLGDYLALSSSTAAMSKGEYEYVTCEELNQEHEVCYTGLNDEKRRIKESGYDH